MRVLWDPQQAGLNLAKHGVRFSDAELVLSDPNALSRDDPTAEREQRFLSIGLDAVGRVLVVVYAYRGEDARLISARAATREAAV